MHKKETIIQAILAQKILPLYYHDDPGVTKDVLEALYNGGIRVVEYTHRGANALQNFQALRVVANERMSDLFLGIGTIKNKEVAKKYLEAGADFIICPSMNTEVGMVAGEKNILWIPGCMTPTEIAAAENAGARLVKIFPGSLLGPAYIKAINDIFPGMMMLVTGGVEGEESNLRNWFEAGVAGVGMGSKLITKSLVEQKDFAGLTASVQKILEMVRQIPTPSTAAQRTINCFSCVIMLR